jgi:hypothetical protein
VGADRDKGLLGSEMSSDTFTDLSRDIIIDVEQPQEDED